MNTDKMMWVLLILNVVVWVAAVILITINYFNHPYIVTLNICDINTSNLTDGFIYSCS